MRRQGDNGAAEEEKNNNNRLWHRVPSNLCDAEAFNGKADIYFALTLIVITVYYIDDIETVCFRRSIFIIFFFVLVLLSPVSNVSKQECTKQSDAMAPQSTFA